MKFKFVGESGGGGKKKRTGQKTFKFVGASASGTSKREEANKLRDELSSCLVDMAQEWEIEPIRLTEAKELVLACVEEVESEGGKPEEWRRMKLNISQIDEIEELVRYIYNYKLRASGLSVNRIVGRRG